MVIIYFLSWTFMLYLIHRIAHKVLILKKYHLEHHKFIIKHTTSWQPNNLLLFNDNWYSTIDLWLTEVIPTLIFCFITNQWWIFIFYYSWAALIQESIEHNPNVHLPLLTSGRWHLIHHNKPNKNFGLFFPIWDITFRTNERILQKI